MENFQEHSGLPRQYFRHSFLLEKVEVYYVVKQLNPKSRQLYDIICILDKTHPHTAICSLQTGTRLRAEMNLQFVQLDPETLGKDLKPGAEHTNHTRLRSTH